MERGTGDTVGLLPLFSWIHNSTYHTFDTLQGLGLVFDAFRNPQYATLEGLRASDKGTGLGCSPMVYVVLNSDAWH